jgi:hypothetical protein
MLVGGYMMAQEVGGSTMGMANKLKSGAMGAAKFAGRQFSKRTGIDSYLSMRRSQKEEKYKARGQAIAGGVGSIQLAAGKVVGGVVGAPGKGVGWGLRKIGGTGEGRGRFRRAMGRAGKEVSEYGVIGAAGRGTVGAVGAGVGWAGGRAGGYIAKGVGAGMTWAGGEEKEGKKKGVRAWAQRKLRGAGKKTSEAGDKAIKRGAAVGWSAGAAVGGMPGRAIDAPANMFTRAGRQSQKLARNRKLDETNKERQAAANLSRDEVMNRAQGKVAGISPAEQRGSIMRAMEQKFITADQVGQFRDAFQGSGSDKASNVALEDIIKKNYPGQAILEESEKADTGVQARLNRGDVDVKNMRPDAVESIASNIAATPIRVQLDYEKQIMGNDQQKTSYEKGLRGVIDKGKPQQPPPDAPPEQQDAYRDSLKSYDNAVGSMMRVNPKEGLATGYKYTDPASLTKNKDESDDQFKARQEKASADFDKAGLEKAAGGIGFGKSAIMFDPQSIADAKGELSDLGKSILQGISTGEFENMAKDSSGKPQQELMQRLIQGIGQLPEKIAQTSKGKDGKDVTTMVDNKQKVDLSAQVTKSRVFADKFPADVDSFKKRSGGGAEVNIHMTGGGGGGSRRETVSSSSSVEDVLKKELGELKAKIDSNTASVEDRTRASDIESGKAKPRATPSSRGRGPA